jgi:hypothetical protein
MNEKRAKIGIVDDSGDLIKKPVINDIEIIALEGGENPKDMDSDMPSGNKLDFTDENLATK